MCFVLIYIYICSLPELVVCRCSSSPIVFFLFVVISSSHLLKNQWTNYNHTWQNGSLKIYSGSFKGICTAFYQNSNNLSFSKEKCYPNRKNTLTYTIQPMLAKKKWINLFKWRDMSKGGNNWTMNLLWFKSFIS